MPSPGFARELATESETWAAEGLVTPEQAAALRARYPVNQSAPQEDGTSDASQILYGTAGILLGAAAIALISVGLDIDAPITLTLIGLAFLGAGIMLHLALPTRHLMADALLVAGLVPLAASGIPDRDTALGWLGPISALAVLAWRREGGFVPPLAVVAFTVGWAVTSIMTLDDASGLAWVVGQGLLVLALAAAGRFAMTRPNTLATALASFAIAPALVGYALVSGATDSRESVEIMIGVTMLITMGVGLWLHDRGMLLGAATALAIDAIVFAFDFGGVITGTLVLVAIAGLLIFQAEALKRFFRTPEQAA